jgi:hypothetical protein
VRIHGVIPCIPLRPLTDRPTTGRKRKVRDKPVKTVGTARINFLISLSSFSRKAYQKKL